MINLLYGMNKDQLDRSFWGAVCSVITWELIRYWRDHYKLELDLLFLPDFDDTTPEINCHQ